MKHGPIALIDDELPVVVIIPTTTSLTKRSRTLRKSNHATAASSRSPTSGLRDPIVMIPCTTFAVPTAEGWDCGQQQSENDGRRTRDVLAANRARARLVASASAPAVGASSVAACRAFDHACGVVQQCLDFRDQRLFRKDSRVLRGIGGEESAGKLRRLSRRLRTGEPRQSVELT
jgi:hypothetical protein